MNVELAERALRAAKANPGRFDMETWFSWGTEFTKDDPAESVPPCGTTACYAGFVSLLHAPAGSLIKNTEIILPGSRPLDVETYATEALEISPDQAATLFYLNNIGEVEGAVGYLADNPDASDTSLREAAGYYTFFSAE